MQCVPLREIGLQGSDDGSILNAARAANAILITKDAKFADRIAALDPPAGAILLRCGNTPNEELRRILATTFPNARRLLDQGARMVEIG